MDCNADLDQLLATARTEVTRMRDAVRDMQAEGTIRVTRDQFGKIATLIDRLVEVLAADGDASFDSPIDGIRWWVPLPVVQRERAELSLLREDNLRLGRELFTPDRLG